VRNTLTQLAFSQSTIRHLGEGQEPLRRILRLAGPKLGLNIQCRGSNQRPGRLKDRKPEVNNQLQCSVSCIFTEDGPLLWDLCLLIMA
jgi:hypothetical protein